MSDPNPYQPSQTELKAPEQNTRRGLSVAAIILMSPFVAMIAGCGGLHLAIQVVLSAESAPGHHDGLLMLVAIATFAVALAAMLRWAWRTHEREQRHNQTEG